MKYTAQVVYNEFTEVFDVEVGDNSIDITLKEIVDWPYKPKNVLTLDLAAEIKNSYSIFPYEPGDLTIIQVQNNFIVANHINDEIKWYKFDANHIIDYLFEIDITKNIIPYLNEDKQILLNSLLSDFVRNDFSFSDLNKKVKYLKVAVILDFIQSSLKCDYSRVILDETLLGDIDVDQIALAFQYSGKKFLELTKINNVLKIMVLLVRENIIDKNIRFVPDTYFINNPKGGEKIKLVFGESGIKFDYQVLPSKNYIFDLADKSYVMNVGNLYKQTVKGKVFVFNGDERDLMLG